MEQQNKISLFNRMLIIASIGGIEKAEEKPNLLIDTTHSEFIGPTDLSDSNRVLDLSLSTDVVMSIDHGDTAMTVKTLIMGVITLVIVPYDAVIEVYADQTKELSLALQDSGLLNLIDDLEREHVPSNATIH